MMLFRFELRFFAACSTSNVLMLFSLTRAGDEIDFAGLNFPPPGFEFSRFRFELRRAFN